MKRIMIVGTPSGMGEGMAHGIACRCDAVYVIRCWRYVAWMYRRFPVWLSKRMHG